MSLDIKMYSLQYNADTKCHTFKHDVCPKRSLRSFLDNFYVREGDNRGFKMIKRIFSPTFYGKGSMNPAYVCLPFVKLFYRKSSYFQGSEVNLPNYFKSNVSFG